MAVTPAPTPRSAPASPTRTPRCPAPPENQPCKTVQPVGLKKISKKAESPSKFLNEPPGGRLGPGLVRQWGRAQMAARLAPWGRHRGGVGGGHAAAALPSEHRHHRAGPGGARRRRRGGRRAPGRSRQRGGRFPGLRLCLHSPLLHAHRGEGSELGGPGGVRGRDAAGGPGRRASGVRSRPGAKEGRRDPAPLRPVRAVGQRSFPGGSARNDRRRRPNRVRCPRGRAAPADGGPPDHRRVGRRDHAARAAPPARSRVPDSGQHGDSSRRPRPAAGRGPVRLGPPHRAAGPAGAAGLGRGSGPAAHLRQSRRRGSGTSSASTSRPCEESCSRK